MTGTPSSVVLSRSRIMHHLSTLSCHHCYPLAGVPATMCFLILLLISVTLHDRSLPSRLFELVCLSTRTPAPTRLERGLNGTLFSRMRLVIASVTSALSSPWLLDPLHQSLVDVCSPHSLPAPLAACWRICQLCYYILSSIIALYTRRLFAPFLNSII
jgi:hypothetical protein